VNGPSHYVKGEELAEHAADGRCASGPPEAASQGTAGCGRAVVRARSCFHYPDGQCPGRG
jgi:hypothetical protein